MSDGTKKVWADLRYGDFEIVAASFDHHPGEPALVIRGEDTLLPDQEDVLRAAGFVPVTGPMTVWARYGGEFKMRELREAFPAMRAREYAVRDTLIRIRGANPLSPNPPTLPDAEEGEEPEVHEEKAPAARVNDYQVAYKPASKLGEPIAVIPKFLAEPTAKALAKFEEIHGSIDEFVAGKLDVTLYELKKMLAPEQIDAVGLGIWATERDRDLIIADQTGLGKGRILACLALAAINAGKNVIFLTEKANLFSDFWRDISDVGAAKKIGKPFILNSGTKIKDVSSVNGDVLFESMKDSETAKVVKSLELPPGCRMLVSTYSQFNKRGSPKAKFLKAVARDAYGLKDEAHNAAGDDSNTADMLDEAFEDTWGMVRSSATFATKVLNLLRYKKALPPSLRTKEAAELLANAGTAAAEVLAAALAEDGILIRREQDLSGMDIKLVIDEKNVDRNRTYQNRLAPILRKMARLQRNVESLIEAKNEEAEEAGGKAAKEKWYTSNFGSRLSIIRRQFLTALSVDQCVERCVELLRQDIKPVIVIESTMEAMMRELAGEKTYDDVEDAADMPENAVPKVTDTPPDFPAALNLMLDRIMQMSVKRGKDSEPEKVPVEDPYFLRDAQAIRDMLANFPPLSLSPIDDIKDRVEAIGRDLFEKGEISKAWQMGEISARNMRVRDGKYESMPKVDRNDTIVAFQNGTYDGAILTGAASTGLSLHASEKALDQRVRCMLELQIARNVRQRSQFWGRIDRRGQVAKPLFEVLATGLLVQTRILIMENNKIRGMYANVTGNAETGKAMENVPDLINSIGNTVAQRILEDQPRLAEAMSIGMRGIDQETADQELYYINKLLGRFDLIDADEADRVFELLLKEFADELAAYMAKGRTVRGVRELDGTWKEVSRRPYEDGDERDGDVFGRPVDLVVMEGTFERDTMSAEKVSGILRASRKRLFEETGKAAGPFFEKHVADIRKRRRSVLTASLAGRYTSVDMALKDKEHNAVKAADERLEKLMKAASMLQPGLNMFVPSDDGDGDRVVATILDIRAPEDSELHHPGRWTVRFAVPGESHAKEISIATLMRDKAYEVVPSRSSEALTPDLRAFDKAPRGLVTERREFLAGNLVKAVTIAAETSSGSMVTYTRPDGTVERSVLVNKRGRRALLNRASKTTDVADARAILDDGRNLFSDFNNRLAGVIIEPQSKGYLLSIPLRGKRFEEAAFKPFCQSFREDRNMLAARVPDENIEDLLRFVFSQGTALHYEGVPVAANTAAPPQPRYGSGRSFGKGFAARR
ncbi:hypothetical protein D3C71_189860 [compost metagenome]